MATAEVIRQDIDELQEDILELEQAARAGIEVGNASDDEIDHQYSGIFYRIPPGESLVVTDRLDWQRAAKHDGMVNGPLLTNKPRVVAKKGDAGTIVRQLLDYDRAGKLGAYLIRNDGKDDARRLRARQRWVDHKTTICRDIQREYIHKMDRIQRSGDAIPTQPQYVKNAIAFLRRVERGEFDATATGLRFRSRVDGADFESHDEVLAYNASTYPDRVAAEGNPDALVLDTMVGGRKPVSKRVEVEPPPPEPPPAPKAEAKDGDVADEILKMAEGLGVALSAAETRGLIRGNQAIINAIRRKLTKVAEEVNGAE